MDKQQIVDVVNRTLSEEFELDVALFTPETHIRDDLKLDSLDIVDMIIALEQAFNFKLPDRSKILHITTMQDLYNFIEDVYKMQATAE